MRLRKRLGDTAVRVMDKAQAASASLPGDGDLQGFRALLGAGEVQTVEAYLIALVGAVRRDALEMEEPREDLYHRARKRRRRLGMVALAGGPWAGVANKLADLYCEAATLCDIAGREGLELSDAEIAAHLLVLWSLAPDLRQAELAIEGEPPVVDLLKAKLLAGSDLELPDPLTKASIVKALREIQSADLRVTLGEARKSARGQPIRSVAFAGHRVKKVIRKSEAQLGLRPA